MPPERELGTLGDQVPFRVGVIAPQRQMRCRGGHIEVALAVQDERENAIPQIEELAEVIATELCARQLPPVIEGIDVRIAADSVGEAFLAPIRSVFAEFGHEVHTPVLDLDAPALADERFDKYGP